MIFSKLSLVPTVLILIFLIKVVNGQFDDPDYYWHLKTGEYIVAHGALPQADIFSYTNAGRPWEKWLRLSEQHSPIYKWNSGGLKVHRWPGLNQPTRGAPGISFYAASACFGSQSR